MGVVVPLFKQQIDQTGSSLDHFVEHVRRGCDATDPARFGPAQAQQTDNVCAVGVESEFGPGAIQTCRTIGGVRTIVTNVDQRLLCPILTDGFAKMQSD